MKRFSWFVVAVVFALALTAATLAAAQTMPVAPAASGTMMEEKRDQGMPMKTDEKSMGGMTAGETKSGGMMKTDEKKDAMGMKMDKDKMPMEKK
jgi:hypothetical protein